MSTEIPPICADISVRRVLLESAVDTFPHPSYMQRCLHLLLRENRNYLHQQKKKRLFSNASMGQAFLLFSPLTWAYKASAIQAGDGKMCVISEAVLGSQG